MFLFSLIPMIIPLALSLDCLDFAFYLFDTRYDWEATSTFYYHWYHIQGDALDPQEASRVKYTHWYESNYHGSASTSLKTFEGFKFHIATLYPELINDTQFICCLEADDPNHELAGRLPYIGKLPTGVPSYDHAYTLRHYHGYNRRYIDVLLDSDGELIGEVDYENERKIWGKQFANHHDCYGEYYRLVHEYPNTLKSREDNDERPSHFPPKPHTIIKEPKGAYIQYFTYGLGFGSLFLVIAKQFLFSI